MLFKFLLLFSVVVSNNADFDGSWADRSCTSVTLKNGRVRWRQRHRLARFMCFQGYILVGSRYASCVNGEWDSRIPVCVRPGCPRPSIDHSLIMERHHDAWLTIFCLPGYKRNGPSVMYCDGRRWNGTAPTCDVAAQTQTTQLSCDFEDPDICGWKQDELHDFDWKRLNTRTPSSFLNTGPPHDHTYGKNGSGYYMYIESTSRIENDTARLISPVFRQALTEDGCFSFYYHMFGRSIGGLRVYQKPDSLPIESMLKLTEGEKQQYLLFELWGNQGDTWYRDVSMLKNQSEDFQIVIEGLRGWSYTSDIAIDDVAILQGQNCSAAKQQASTPPDLNSETCLGRCNLLGELENSGTCQCSISCIDHQKCCADFFEVCVFNGEWPTTDDDKATSGDLPQTEKLVASNASESIEHITTIPTTVTTTIKTTTIGSPIATSKLKTTTAKVIKTTPSIKLTTTKKTTPKPSVTPNATLSKNATRVISTKATTLKPTIKTTKVMFMTSTLRSVALNAKTLVGDESSNSGWRTTLLVIAILICCVGLVWIAHEARGSRGRLLMARLRGRAQRDPEVRYLHADTDDQ
ncbi:MAM and LDL-receptor class A domain-containing protein 1 [Amyelois transitella]|uniref:MAM and LDL-receptor class A domain-containing protein 1 n=1 Tax=Amyelois transitella TaxID=680683 RepID=UPI00067C5D63|nr:MAM and LDL-receptor class A domain-containing protein 1 [Amyelois transitella]